MLAPKVAHLFRGRIGAGRRAGWARPVPAIARPCSGIPTQRNSHAQEKEHSKILQLLLHCSIFRARGSAAGIWWGSSPRVDFRAGAFEHSRLWAGDRHVLPTPAGTSQTQHPRTTLDPWRQTWEGPLKLGCPPSMPRRRAADFNTIPARHPLVAPARLAVQGIARRG